MWQVTLADIQQARARIAGRVKRTPLERNDTLSRRLGTNVYLKLELFQKTGSFKVRGAFNKVVAERIVWAWILTIPMAAFMAALSYYALRVAIAP